METFTVAATKLYQMRTFCKAVVEAAAGTPSSESHDQARVGVRKYVSCRTYEAFADALHCCLDHLTHDVRKVEKTIVQHCEWIFIFARLLS